jgi:hypothetical protein
LSQQVTILIAVIREFAGSPNEQAEGNNRRLIGCFADQASGHINAPK